MRQVQARGAGRIRMNHNKPPIKKAFLFIFFNLFVLFGLILIDQFLKYFIRSKGGFYICNENAAFGIKMPSLVFWLAIGFFLVIALNNLRFVVRDPNINRKLLITSRSLLGTILILSGGLSNIIDRALFGCVIDFIDLKIWPVFNLADLFITAGVILFVAEWAKILYYKAR
jgi:lipoprotein signal peptidase